MATSAQLDSRCRIEFIGADLANEEPKMLAAVLERMILHMHAAGLIDVYCAERRKDGWLEWQIHIHNREHVRVLVLGVVQRAVGAEVEFHS